MILTIQPEKEVGDALLGFLAFGLIENLIVQTYTYHRFGVSASNEFTTDGYKVYAMICCSVSTIIATVCVYFSIEKNFDWSLILTATVIIQLVVRYFFFDLKVGLVQFLGVMIGLTSILVSLLLIKEQIVTGLFELATALQINIIICLMQTSVSEVSYEAQATFIQIGFGLTLPVLWVLNLTSFSFDYFTIGASVALAGAFRLLISRLSMKPWEFSMSNLWVFCFCPLLMTIPNIE